MRLSQRVLEMKTGKLFAVLATILLTAASTTEAAEIQISTENTTSHFQTVVLQTYAAALNSHIPEHNFEVIHSARAFSDRDVAEAVSSGRVAIAAPGIWHLGRYSSDLNALLLPSFMGLGAADVRAVVDGPVGRTLQSALEKQLNVKVIGRWLDLGPAHIFTREKEITSFEDLKGLRIRYPGGEANALRLSALGAIPVLIPWPNVPEALDREEIDGLLTTTSTVVSAALWDHGINYAFLSHSYYPFYLPLISGDIWNRLPAQQRRLIEDDWEAMIEDGRALAVRHQEQSLFTLREHGIEITTPSSEERDHQRSELLGQQHSMADIIGISEETKAVIEAIRN